VANSICAATGKRLRKMPIDAVSSEQVRQSCGQAGCRDHSPKRHTTKHFTQLAIWVIEGYVPPEGWGWYVGLNLSDRATPELGPIPRYIGGNEFRRLSAGCRRSRDRENSRA
jgi:hypothetical protein